MKDYFLPIPIGNDIVQHYLNRLFLYLAPTGHSDFSPESISRRDNPITAGYTFSHRRGRYGISYAEEEGLCKEVEAYISKSLQKKDPRYRFDTLVNLHARMGELFQGLWQEVLPNRRGHSLYGVPRDIGDDVIYSKLVRNYKLACCIGLLMPGGSVIIDKAKKRQWGPADYLDLLSPEALQEWQIFFSEYPELERLYYDIVSEIGIYLHGYDLWCQTFIYLNGAGRENYPPTADVENAFNSFTIANRTIQGFFRSFVFASLICSKFLHPVVREYYLVHVRNARAGQDPPYYPFLYDKSFSTYMDAFYLYEYFTRQILWMRDYPILLFTQYGKEEYKDSYLDFVSFVGDYYAYRLPNVFLGFSVFDPLPSLADFIGMANGGSIPVLPDHCYIQPSNGPFFPLQWHLSRRCYPEVNDVCRQSIRRFLMQAYLFFAYWVNDYNHRESFRNWFDFARPDNMNVNPNDCAVNPGLMESPNMVLSIILRRVCKLAPVNTFPLVGLHAPSMIHLDSFINITNYYPFYSVVDGLWSPIVLCEDSSVQYNQLLTSYFQLWGDMYALNFGLDWRYFIYGQLYQQRYTLGAYMLNGDFSGFCSFLQQMYWECTGQELSEDTCRELYQRWAVYGGMHHLRPYMTSFLIEYDVKGFLPFIRIG